MECFLPYLVPKVPVHCAEKKPGKHLVVNKGIFFTEVPLICKYDILCDRPRPAPEEVIQHLPGLLA